MSKDTEEVLERTAGLVTKFCALDVYFKSLELTAGVSVSVDCALLCGVQLLGAASPCLTIPVPLQPHHHIALRLQRPATISINGGHSILLDLQACRSTDAAALAVTLLTVQSPVAGKADTQLPAPIGIGYVALDGLLTQLSSVPSALFEKRLRCSALNGSAVGFLECIVKATAVQPDLNPLLEQQVQLQRALLEAQKRLAASGGAVTSDAGESADSQHTRGEEAAAAAAAAVTVEDPHFENGEDRVRRHGDGHDAVPAVYSPPPLTCVKLPDEDDGRGRGGAATMQAAVAAALFAATDRATLRRSERLGHASTSERPAATQAQDDGSDDTAVAEARQLIASVDDLLARILDEDRRTAAAKLGAIAQARQAAATGRSGDGFGVNFGLAPPPGQADATAPGGQMRSSFVPSAETQSLTLRRSRAPPAALSLTESTAGHAAAAAAAAAHTLTLPTAAPAPHQQHAASGDSMLSAGLRRLLVSLYEGPGTANVGAAGVGGAPAAPFAAGGDGDLATGPLDETAPPTPPRDQMMTFGLGHPSPSSPSLRSATRRRAHSDSRSPGPGASARDALPLFVPEAATARQQAFALSFAPTPRAAADDAVPAAAAAAAEDAMDLQQRQRLAAAASDGMDRQTERRPRRARPQHLATAPPVTQAGRPVGDGAVTGVRISRSVRIRLAVLAEARRIEAARAHAADAAAARWTGGAAASAAASLTRRGASASPSAAANAAAAAAAATTAGASAATRFAAASAPGSTAGAGATSASPRTAAGRSVRSPRQEQQLGDEVRSAGGGMPYAPRRYGASSSTSGGGSAAADAGGASNPSSTSDSGAHRQPLASTARGNIGNEALPQPTAKHAHPQSTARTYASAPQAVTDTDRSLSPPPPPPPLPVPAVPQLQLPLGAYVGAGAGRGSLLDAARRRLGMAPESAPRGGSHASTAAAAALPFFAAAFAAAGVDVSDAGTRVPATAGAAGGDQPMVSPPRRIELSAADLLRDLQVYQQPPPASAAAAGAAAAATVQHTVGNVAGGGAGVHPVTATVVAGGSAGVHPVTATVAAANLSAASALGTSAAASAASVSASAVSASASASISDEEIEAALQAQAAVAAAAASAAAASAAAAVGVAQNASAARQQPPTKAAGVSKAAAAASGDPSSGGSGRSGDDNNEYSQSWEDADTDAEAVADAVAEGAVVDDTAPAMSSGASASAPAAVRSGAALASASFAGSGAALASASFAGSSAAANAARAAIRVVSFAPFDVCPSTAPVELADVVSFAPFEPQAPAVAQPTSASSIGAEQRKAAAAADSPSSAAVETSAVSAGTCASGGTVVSAGSAGAASVSSILQSGDITATSAGSAGSGSAGHAPLGPPAVLPADASDSGSISGSGNVSRLSSVVGDAALQLPGGLRSTTKLFQLSGSDSQLFFSPASAAPGSAARSLAAGGRAAADDVESAANTCAAGSAAAAAPAAAAAASIGPLSSFAAAAAALRAAAGSSVAASPSSLSAASAARGLSFVDSLSTRGGGGGGGNDSSASVGGGRGSSFALGGSGSDSKADSSVAAGQGRKAAGGAAAASPDGVLADLSGMTSASERS